jgi:hypothetical protein
MSNASTLAGAMPALGDRTFPVFVPQLSQDVVDMARGEVERSGDGIHLVAIHPHAEHGLLLPMKATMERD